MADRDEVPPALIASAHQFAVLLTSQTLTPAERACSNGGGKRRGFEAPADAVSRARDYLATVFEDKENEEIGDRTDALEISRKFEAKKIAPQTVHVTRREEADRREAWREYEIGQRRKELIMATSKSRRRAGTLICAAPTTFLHRDQSGRPAAGTLIAYTAAKSGADSGPNKQDSMNKTGMSGVGIVGDIDDTHYAYSGRCHHDRAVTGLRLVNLHDGKRGTRETSQGASLLARQRTLLG